VIVAAVAAPVAAQPQEREGPEVRAARRQRDEAFKMVDAYIVSNLQESLGLTDEQFVKLLPLVKKLQSDRRTYFQRRVQILQELRRTLGSGVATEARVSDLLKELKVLETDEPAAIRRDMAAVDAVLSPVQQAKYRVMEAEVERKIRDLMAQIRLQRGDAPRRRQPDERPQS
jgi:Spy/CpxP family protein refolding chaperone